MPPIEFFSDPDHDVTANMLKALGHPVRLALMKHLLAQRCCCCGELCDCFDQSQSTVSQHLAVMKDAGLLDARRDGTRMLYSVNETAIAKLSHVLVGLKNLAAERKEFA